MTWSNPDQHNNNNTFRVFKMEGRATKPLQQSSVKNDRGSDIIHAHQKQRLAYKILSRQSAVKMC